MLADLIAYLLADTTLTGLVATRIWPGRRPQGDPSPAITVFRVSHAPEYADDGEAGLDRARVQIDVWAASLTVAQQVADAVRSRLSAVMDVTQGGTEFVFITLENEQDAGETQFEFEHRVTQDFEIWYR